MKSIIISTTVCLASVILIACLTSPAAADEVSSSPLPLVDPVCLTPGMLGTATIDENSVITLTYRGPNPDETGYAVLIYRPGTPDYSTIHEHIGDLQPGQIVQIAPWRVIDPV